MDYLVALAAVSRVRSVEPAVPGLRAEIEK